MKWLIILLPLLLLGAGCGDDDSPSGPEQGGGDQAYYPLSVGNQWVYDRDGSVTISGIPTTTIAGENVTDITGTVTHDLGFQVYVQETAISDTITTLEQTIYLDSTFTSYVRMTDQGFYSYVSLAGSDSLAFVPFPLQVGATWQFSEDPLITGEILSLSETVTVPAGTFENCLELKTTWIESGNTVINITDFAPNVGRVKNVYTQSYQSIVTTVTSVLLSYSVN